MNFASYLRAATAIALVLSSTSLRAEVVIVKELNLRQSQLNKIADVAKESLGTERQILSVRTYKLPGGPKEARVTFEPNGLDQQSFETETVTCRKTRSTWVCEDPHRERYYYENQLSNSIALGKGVSPSVAKELIHTANSEHGGSRLVSTVLESRYIGLGGGSSITKISDTEYVILGWCNCSYERKEANFQFKQYVDILE